MAGAGGAHRCLCLALSSHRGPCSTGLRLPCSHYYGFVPPLPGRRPRQLFDILISVKYGLRQYFGIDAALNFQLAEI